MLLLKHHVKITLRNFLKFKGFAAINILGLAIGIACCLLIVQHVRHELSYDQHHDHLDRLYRIGTMFSDGEREVRGAMTPSPMGWYLADNYPEVESIARILEAPNTTNYLIRYGEKAYFEKKGYLVDSTFFELLKFDFIEGDPSSAVDEPFQVVISKSLAQRLFGEESAVGKTISIGNQWSAEEYRVTGVVDPVTFPSHIDGNFYMNMRSGPVGRRWFAMDEWAGNNMFRTYVRLKPNVSPRVLEEKFPALVEEKAGEKLKAWGTRKEHFLEAVKDIYLKSDLTFQIGPTGNQAFVYIFGVIAAFILGIACINFMNLSTAKSTLRAQEVGIRKVVGAGRKSLITQFFAEAFVYSSAAMLVAFLIAKLALPGFNQIAEKELTLDFGHDPMLSIWLVGIALATALIAGSYPALYLSGFDPVKIFKGTIGERLSAGQIRKALVVLQFIISIALIQGIFIIQQQLQYLREKNLGFGTEARIVIPMNTSEAAENFTQLKAELVKIPNVEAVGASTSVPGTPNVEDMLVYGEGQSSNQTSHTNFYWIDTDYLSMMEFQLVAGRVFDRNRIADTVRSSVINERLVSQLGYTLETAPGKRFFWTWNGETHEHEIIGIVRDFHATSLRSELDNHAFFWSPQEYFRYAVASIRMHDLAQTIPQLSEAWTRVNPNEPFDHFFLDEQIGQAYHQDRRLARLITGFTFLAVFISCLGLLGLAAFAAESRTKEIGVRKVLGASVRNIVALLSREFVSLIVIALIIASPLAWYFMNEWLASFVYRIDIQWWVFLLGGLVAIVIAFVTVGFQSIKAATANPVVSLRSE